MLMTYNEGDWLMRMPDQEDIHRDSETDRLGHKEGLGTSLVGDVAANEEKARALQDFARRMDKVMLGWMRKAHRKEKDQ